MVPPGGAATAASPCTRSTPARWLRPKPCAATAASSWSTTAARTWSIYTNVDTVGVKQGQRVQRGQKIAEIGPTEGGRATLHFEIRYRGKAVDPRLCLPAK
ncbi:M23 family metallopeptidase [Verminephrobacter eiseniae]|uniref:M23 family metallopeptidase n=1 Tax=Verminephrobacter eiseniae TaxID=364317 RepID=UPI002AA2A6A7|nr:M23 family metallopeptidase [Verminephrobacter eiseniae]